MSKVVANQQGSRGATLAKKRRAFVAKWTTGDAEGMQAEGTRELGKGWGQQQPGLARSLQGLPQRKPL